MKNWPWRNVPNTPFTINRDSPQARGLIAWWPFVASRGAAVMRDLVGLTPLTVPASADWVNTYGGPGIFFNADADALAIRNASTVPLPTWNPQVGSVVIWFVLNAVTNTRHIFTGFKSGSLATTRCYIFINNNRIYTRLGDGAELDSGLAPAAGLLSCVVLTWNVGATTSYLDGREGGSGSYTDFTTQQDYLLFGTGPGANLYTPGNILEVRIYNRALSAREAREQYGPDTRYELYQPIVPVWVVGSVSGAAPQTITLDTLTVAGSIPDLGVSPGVIAILLDALNLASSTPGLSVTAAVSILLDSLTLTGSAESLTVLAGAVAILLDSLTLAGSAEGITVLAGAVAVLLDTLTLAGAAESLTVTAAVAIVLDTLALAGAVPALTVSGAVSIMLDSLTLAGSVEDLTVVTGVIVLLSALTLAGSAEPLTVSPGAVAVLLDSLTLAGSAESLAVLTGITVILASLTLAGSVPDLSLVPGGVSLDLDTLTLAGSVESLAVMAAVVIALDTLTLAGNAETLALMPGGVTIALDELTLAGSVENISVITGIALEVLLRGMYKGMYRGMR